MKIILAIDTSSSSTGAAVAEDGRVLAATSLVRQYRHAESIFEQIDQVLREAGLTKGDLTGIAVTRGPGSFTGLRVGIATAKGLSFGLSLPVAGVSSLAALAHPARGFEGAVAPMFDARKQQVYAAAHGPDGRTLIGENAWDPEDFAERLASLGMPVLAMGSGAGTYRDIFGERLGSRLTVAEESVWNIDPASVAILGYEEFSAGRAVDAAMLKPVYLRLSEAEENRKKA